MNLVAEIDLAFDGRRSKSDRYLPLRRMFDRLVATVLHWQPTESGHAPIIP
jgi:hypothetical protein